MRFSIENTGNNRAFRVESVSGKIYRQDLTVRPLRSIMNMGSTYQRKTKGKIMENAIYMRVSKGRGQDTASQKPDLERWAAAQSEPSKVYTDYQTGKTMDRPGFNRLMADIRTGKVKTVVVWRLDRLGRTAKGLTALFDDLQALKVNLVSLKDGLDLATPAGASWPTSWRLWLLTRPRSGLSVFTPV